MKPINVETITYANGTKVSDLSDDQIYGLIAESEAQIKKYKDLTNKPKRIEQRILALEAGIQELIKVVDSQARGDLGNKV